MGVEDWSTDESQNLDLDGSDISRRASPGAPANELTRKLMAHVKELEEKIVSDGIAVDGITIENNSGTLTVKDVAIDGDTTDLLTAKIEEIEAAATQAGEDATAAQTAATQAAASAASVETSVTAAATAANAAAEQSDIAARAAARAQSGAAMAESAVQAVIAGTNLNWQKSEKAGAVTVYPVPETTLEPTVDFMFTETPPASGDKGPDNPSTISGVTSVNAGRIGKNLLLKTGNYAGSQYSRTSNNDGSYTINGSGLGNISICDSQAGSTQNPSSVKLNTNKTYTLSATVASGSVSGDTYLSIVRFTSQASVLIPSSGTASVSFQASNFADGLFVCRLLFNNNSVLTNAVLKFQLEEGDTATDFEPPMLPADANNSISLGSTYYGGEIDLATGVMTVTFRGIVFKGTESFSFIDNGDYYRYRFNISDYIAPSGATLYPVLDMERCTHFTIRNSTDLSFAHAIAYGTRLEFFTSQQTVDDFKQWLAAQYSNGTPVVVAYPLATPFTVQLDPTQILSLAQIDKYTPRINTVYTDASAVQVGYAKSPIRSEYELTQAIIATEGGE